MNFPFAPRHGAAEAELSDRLATAMMTAIRSMVVSPESVLQIVSEAAQSRKSDAANGWLLSVSDATS